MSILLSRTALVVALLLVVQRDQVPLYTERGATDLTTGVGQRPLNANLLLARNFTRVPLRRRTPGRSGPGGVTRTTGNGRASLSEDPADEHCAPRDQEHAQTLRARAVQFKFSHADDIEKHDLRLSSGRLGPAGG